MYTPILPSSLLSFRNPDDFDIGQKFINNTTLKIGVVTDVIEVDNAANITKQGPEYNVMVIAQDKNGGICSESYRNCLRIDMFGGVGEFLDAKLHAPDKAAAVLKSGSLTKDNNGSIVLLLCVDGNTEKGIIIGAIKHPGRKTTLTSDAGKHLEGEYNGINWQVNKDGELVVTYKSSTDNDGKTSDDKAGGTFLKVDKTGSIDINDNTGENIKIDKVAQTVAINATKDIITKTGGNFKLTATKDISASTKSDLIIQAQGKAGITIGKDMNLEVTNALTGKAMSLDLNVQQSIKIQSNQIQINGQQFTINSPQFTISGNQVQIRGSQIMLGNGGTPAVTMMSKAIGIGNLGAPVISSFIGPFSSVVMIS